MRKIVNDSRLLIVLLSASLAGCSWLPDYANPIEWYRDATGASKNDSADQGQRNAQNLEAGSEAPYPNLASVPPPPERAMSTVDREKLQKGLVADRAHALYSDEQLRQGHSVPPLPGDKPSQPAADPITPTAAASPSAGPAAAGADAAAPPAATAAAGGAAAPVTPPPAGQATTAKGQRAAPAKKGSEPAPQESPLTTPSVRSLPTGERALTPPPPPNSAPPQQEAALAPPPPATRSPAAPAAQPSAVRVPRGPHAAVTMEAAEIGFGSGGPTLSAEDNQHLAEVARLQKQGGGSLRVIGYARRGVGAHAAEEQLQSFGEALDRANLVAQALIKLGVPARRINVQAAPELADGGLAAGQVVVLLDY